MIKIFCAMPREKKSLGMVKTDVIGIGATKVPVTTDNDIIINVGLCGANSLPVGSVVVPFDVLKPINDYEFESGALTLYEFADNVTCITAKDFVTEPIIKADNVIYDMELFKLTKIPHKRLYAVKIVSDNLNEKDCENFDEAIAWATAREIVRKIIKEEKKFAKNV